jgi:predicted O-methyltransferase YrrM
MKHLIRLYDIFEQYGFNIHGGVYPWHFDRLYPIEATRLHIALPFVGIAKKGKNIGAGGGINPLEVMLLTGISESFRPKNIFAIGNAFGWSTFALALSNPSANIVAIDALIEGADAREMFDTVQNIIKQEGFHNTTVLEASSPNDVASVVTKHFDESIDLVFIDGDHSNAQQILDFEAVYPHLSSTCIVLLHDVLNWGMVPSFNELRKKYNHLNADILLRTPSGMGVFYSKDLPVETQKIISAFTESKQKIKHFQQHTKNKIDHCIRNVGIKLDAKVDHDKKKVDINVVLTKEQNRNQ